MLLTKEDGVSIFDGTNLLSLKLINLNMERKKYEKEFKSMIVGLLNTGLSPTGVGVDYGLNASMITRWKREYNSQSGTFTNKSVLTAEQEELKKLKKELRNVKLERDILKKAVSIFSKSDQ
jgi:transposase